MTKTSRREASFRLLFGLLGLHVGVACSSDTGGPASAGGTGGALASGGSAALGGAGGGNATSNAGGGSGRGGAASGGIANSGSGASTAGGMSSGGASSGGANSVGQGGVAPGTGGAKAAGGSGGTATGGAKAAGGAPSGGTTTGGTNAAGGSATGGVVTGGATASGNGGNVSGGTSTGGRSSAGGAAAGGAAAGGATHTGVWKVMPLGDSITGSTCYPQLTAQTLKNGGHTNFQFVGSNQNNQNCNGALPQQTEGHGGYLVTYLTTDNPPQSGKGTLTELKTWATAKPDIVLMHYGTNDAWSSLAPANVLAAYVRVLTEFRSQNPAVIFFVSKIIPLAPSGCSNCPTNVVNLDAQITDAWAQANSTATSPVYIIDHWTGFNAATDTSDGAHPNVTGAQKMATVTYNALVAKGYF